VFSLIPRIKAVPVAVAFQIRGVRVMTLSHVQAIGTFTMISLFCASSLSARAQDRGAIAEDSVVAVTPGNLQRIRLIEDERSRVEGEYPSEGLRIGIPGHVGIKFNLNEDGSITDPTHGEGAFYDAALRILRRLKFSRIDGSLSGPADPYLAVVHFIPAPCVAIEPSVGIDYAFTVCASRDATAPLHWEAPWPAGPVYPESLNELLPREEAKRLRFVGTWQPGRSHFGTDPWTNGVIEIGPDEIKDLAGRVSATYSIVASEQFAAVLKVGRTDGGLEYWRLDALTYDWCRTAGEGLNCAKPFDRERFDLRIYSNLDDALSLNSTYSRWSAYFPFDQ
jgi:hypothetical protein